MRPLGGTPSVVAVIPAYGPPKALPGLVEALARQVDAVVVVDDGSSAGHEVLGECADLGAEVVSHACNRGIAAALNTGVAQAFSRQPSPGAVLTVDQDSQVSAGYVAALVAAWQAARQAAVPVGLVAPQYVAGLPDQSRDRSGDVLLGRDPIQSGTLLPATTWEALGPFDESLVIDGVDTDYALRCLDAGLAVVVAASAHLGHSLGDQVRVGPVQVTGSAPFRYYYLGRNRITLVRRHGRHHPGWAAGQVVGLAGHLALVLALAPGRRDRLRAVTRGVRDGIRGRTGPDPGS